MFGLMILILLLFLFILCLSSIPKIYCAFKCIGINCRCLWRLYIVMLSKIIESGAIIPGTNCLDPEEYILIICRNHILFLMLIDHFPIITLIFTTRLEFLFYLFDVSRVVGVNIRTIFLILLLI